MHKKILPDAAMKTAARLKLRQPHVITVNGDVQAYFGIAVYLKWCIGRSGIFSGEFRERTAVELWQLYR
jgi:hypothetical protein